MVKEERHGKMTYMENHFDKRLDPRLTVPGAKSVIYTLAIITLTRNKLKEHQKFQNMHLVLIIILSSKTN